jgi:hypothetical protein
MKNTLSKSAAALVVVGGVLAVLTGNAFAATSSSVTDAFATMGTDLSTYIGLGIAVVIAAVGAGIGVRLLIKYVRRASSNV